MEWPLLFVRFLPGRWRWMEDGWMGYLCLSHPPPTTIHKMMGDGQHSHHEPFAFHRPRGHQTTDTTTQECGVEKLRKGNKKTQSCTPYVACDQLIKTDQLSATVRWCRDPGKSFLFLAVGMIWKKYSRWGLLVKR